MVCYALEQSWMSPPAMAECPHAKLTHPPAFGEQGQCSCGR